MLAKHPMKASSSRGQGVANGSSAPPAGPGFAAAAALARGVADGTLSMAGAAMDETNYEMKEDGNFEMQQSLDDIDDFERRLAGGGAVRAPPRAAQPPPPTRAAGPRGAQGVPGAAAASGAAKRSGADYVKSAHRGFAKAPARGKKAEDDEDDADDVRQAMKDLDRFELNHGVDHDDD